MRSTQTMRFRTTMAAEMLRTYVGNLRTPLGLRPLLHYCACALAIAMGLIFWGLTLASHLVEIRLSFAWLFALWASFAAVLIMEVIWRPSIRLISGIGFFAAIGPSTLV